MNKAELNPRPKERRVPRWRGDYYFSIHCLLLPPLSVAVFTVPISPTSPFAPTPFPSLPIPALPAPFCVRCSRAGSHCIVRERSLHGLTFPPLLQSSIMASITGGNLFPPIIVLLTEACALSVFDTESDG